MDKHPKSGSAGISEDERAKKIKELIDELHTVTFLISLFLHLMMWAELLFANVAPSDSINNQEP